MPEDSRIFKFTSMTGLISKLTYRIIGDTVKSRYNDTVHISQSNTAFTIMVTCCLTTAC